MKCLFEGNVLELQGGNLVGMTPLCRPVCLQTLNLEVFRAQRIDLVLHVLILKQRPPGHSGLVKGDTIDAG